MHKKEEQLLASSLREEILAAVWRFEVLTGKRVTEVKVNPYADSHEEFSSYAKEAIVYYRDPVTGDTFTSALGQP